MNSAPPETYFQDLANDIAGGHTVTMNSATKNRDRRKMRAAWCLHESLLAIDRSFLRKAESICLFRDERQSRLLLRFRAVHEDLGMWSGILGQVRDLGTGATCITEGTLKVIRDHCTSMRNCKHNYRKVPAPFDRPLYNHILATTHMITVDAAPDEVLSAEMMRSERLWKEHTTLFKDLKFILRDKTHGARRYSGPAPIFFFDSWLLQMVATAKHTADTANLSNRDQQMTQPNRQPTQPTI